MLQCLLDPAHSLATEAALSDAGPALPTYTHLQGPLSAVRNSQGSSTVDRESIDRFVDAILDGSLERFVDVECLERV